MKKNKSKNKSKPRVKYKDNSLAKKPMVTIAANNKINQKFFVLIKFITTLQINAKNFIFHNPKNNFKGMFFHGTARCANHPVLILFF